MNLEKQHNIFYKTTNLVNDKFYYGIHSTNNLNDGYIGSGKLLKKSIEKYGKENFIKEMLFDFATRKEASDYERLIVNLELIALEQCYNCKPGGDIEIISEKMSTWQIGKTVSESTKQKISETKRRRANLYRKNIENRRKNNNGSWHTEETKQKISNTLKGKYCGKNSSNFGKKRNEETLKKLSIGMKGKLTGEKNPMYGKHHTPESKRRMSQSRSGERNFNYGKHLTQETKEKIRNRHLGRKFSEETIRKMRTSTRNKQACKINGIIYESMNDAARNLKIKGSAVKYRVKSNYILWANWIKI